jgi:hypothetical protein
MNRTRILPLCLVSIALLLWGCSASDKPEHPPDEQTPPLSADKQKVRNNAASLLYDLLGNEKNLSKLFILKGGRAELKSLVKTISSAAATGQKQLEALAKKDSTLKLDAANLPPGEQATRDAIAKAKEHELLRASGADLEFNLLLTQADALGYGSQLAKIAAQNSARAEQVQEFNTIGATLENLHKQVLALLRNPAK